MKFRKVCGTSIASIAVISALAGCSDSSGGSGSSGTSGAAIGPLEKTNLVVDAFPAIDSAGLFIAEQEGLFKAQGLNVKIDLATTSQAAVTGQLAGTYDITSADYVTYVDNVLLDKAPLRIVAESSFLQPNVLTLLVKGGSRVTSVGELRNRTVSVNAPNDIGTLLIDSVLTEHGVAPNSVHFNNTVQFPAAEAALAQGQIDAAFVPEPFVSLNEMQGGDEELADLDQGAATDFPIQASPSPRPGRAGTPTRSPPSSVRTRSDRRSPTPTAPRSRKRSRRSCTCRRSRPRWSRCPASRPAWTRPACSAWWTLWSSSTCWGSSSPTSRSVSSSATANPERRRWRAAFLPDLS